MGERTCSGIDGWNFRGGRSVASGLLARLADLIAEYVTVALTIARAIANLTQRVDSHDTNSILSDVESELRILIDFAVEVLLSFIENVDRLVLTNPAFLRQSLFCVVRID